MNPALEQYPRALSDKPRRLRDELTARMRSDESGRREVLNVPESLADLLPTRAENR